MQVIKRDGRLVEFNKERIVNAVTKAMIQTPEGIDIDLANKIAEAIEKQLENVEQINVYEIQDLVEKKLMGSSRKEVAQTYITYRYNRDIARRSKTQDVFLDIIRAKSNDMQTEKLNSSSDIPKEMMIRFASEVMKPFVDTFLLSPKVRAAEKEGYIYICGKDYYPTKSLNSIQAAFGQILKNGCNIRGNSIQAPSTIEEAMQLVCIAMLMIQKEIDGGQSIPAFDYFFAPYVKKTYEEELKKQKDFEKYEKELKAKQPKEYVKKEVEGLSEQEQIVQIAINRTVDRVHHALKLFLNNINMFLVNLGKQAIASSINYGTDTSAEGRCMIREILQLTYEETQKGKTPIFPLQIWKKKRGINFLPDDINYDLYQLALKVTSEVSIPRYLNLDATFNKAEKWKKEDENRWYYEPAIAGRRIRNFETISGEKTAIGKGNLSSVLINLPKIAIETSLKVQEKVGLSFELGKGSEEKMPAKYKEEIRKVFKQELENNMKMAALQLYDRFKFQSTAVARQFPALMSGIWKDSETLKQQDTVEEVIKQGSLSIGFIGLAEALIVLTGKHHGESEEAQILGIEIISYMQEIAKNLSEEYGMLYGIMGMEAKKKRFIAKDRIRYGEIKGVTDKENYTDSSEIPVQYECSIEKRAKTEAPYHELCRAGNIFYAKLSEEEKDIQNVQNIVELLDKYNMGYLGIIYDS